VDGQANDLETMSGQRLLLLVANWYFRPIGVGGGLLGERPIYLGT
jgi:hypothetical protein